MIKTKLSKVLMALLVSWTCLSINSCSEKEEPIPPQGEDNQEVVVPIEFSTSVMNALGSEPMSEGTDVAILIGEEVHEFKANAEGKLTANSTLNWKDEQVQVVKAWTPFSKTCPTEFDVSTYQEDFMYGVTNADPSKENTLKFYHQLVKIEVILNTEKQIDNVTAGSDSFILNGNWTATENGGVWSEAQQVKKGKLSLKPDGAKKFSALAIPQEISSQKFIYATIDGQLLYFSIDGTLNLEAGSIYTFNLSPSDGIEANPTPTLNADKAEILADGLAKVTFTATPEDRATIVGIGHTYEGQNNSTFSTKVPGTYKFKAICGEKETEPLTITAYAAPILSADPTTIKVGESTSFKVIFKDRDRTSDATFTKDGSTFNGTTFTPDIPGEYSFKAMIDGHETNIITIKVNEAEITPPVPQEIPLTLTADFYEAKSYETIPYTVTCRGKVIESGFQFYMSENGTRFTGVEGDELIPWKTDKNFFAVVTYDGMTSNVIQIKCTSNPNKSAQPVDPGYPQIGLSKTEMSADGKDQVIISVSPAGATIICDKETSISGNIFKTTVAQDYTFKAQYNGKETFGVTVKANPAAIGPNPADPIILTASKTTIANNGEETFLIAKQSNINVTSKAEFKASKGIVKGNSFTCNETGIVDIYAVLNGKKSNTIQINVIEDPNSIMISGNKTKLIANGIDELILITTPSDAAVTYTKDGGPKQTLNGKTFKTAEPGTYTFHATAKGKESKPFVVTAYAPDDPEAPMEGDITINGNDGAGWQDQTHDDTIIIK